MDEWPDDAHTPSTDKLLVFLDLKAVDLS